MTEKQANKIGLIIGKESTWADEFISAVNRHDPAVEVELVKLGGTLMDEPCAYRVIIDRMSHEVPYYLAYLKYASLMGCYIINNPFISAADDKFLGLALAGRLGVKSPRTVLLPNKRVEATNVPESFRNLQYPMDWDGIIDYVGIPALLKDALTGGRRLAYQVHNVDELIEHYDQSDTLNVVLQQVVEADTHLHCFVIGQEKVLPLKYDPAADRYLPDTVAGDSQLGQQLVAAAQVMCQAYGYDFNLVEFAHHNGELYLINPSNPTAAMDRQLFSEEQFRWLVDAVAGLAVHKATQSSKQRMLFSIPDPELPN